MIINFHAHLWDGNFEGNKRKILKACELYGIDMINISSLVGQYPNEKEISLLNLETYKFICEEKSRIGGFPI